MWNMPKCVRGALVLWAVMAVSVMADPYSLEPRGDSFAYHPSPEDWRDINMYQIFTDRFFDGNSGNNNIRGWHTTDGYRHYAMGGDWAGVKEKLPYLAGMGVNAVWISGVQMNAQGRDTRYAPYHAYHPTDFYRVEPMFGTFEELKDLIDTAHSMGIYVMIDVVINHMADLLTLGGHLDDYFHPHGGGNLHWFNSSRQHAWPFDSPQWFNNNGKILDWYDSHQVLWGAFVGTDDLKTSEGSVQGHLIDIFKHLIDVTDCDGFRVDAIKHVERDFMMHWAQEMRNHAAYRGKNNFLLFGEDYNYDDYQVGLQCNEHRGGTFNSALYFPMQLTMKNVFAYEQGTRQITDRYANLHNYGSGAQNLVTFMDNHDVDRIALEMGDAWEAKMRPALTFLYTGTPVPCLFYGTEHGFNQGYQRNQGLTDGDYQREVMWNFGYQPGNAWGDKFNASPTYNYIAQLNELRRNHRSLTRGSFTQRWHEDSKGIYAYTRVYENEEALVIFNTDWHTRSATPAVEKPDGTTFVNVLNPGETATVQGGTLNVSVGSKESKIFIAGSSMSVSTECDGEFLTVRYNPAGGPLDGILGAVHVGIGHDGYMDQSTFAMMWDNDAYTYSYSLTSVVRTVEFYFHDNADESVRMYDNRNGADWHVDVIACRASGAPLAWVGGTHHWPSNEDLTPSDNLWINVYAEPAGAAGGASLVYSSDGGHTWHAMMMNHSGTTENDHDGWHANIGSFPAGTQIRYAVEVIGAHGSIWDNNNQNDYIAQVGVGGAGTIQWMGNTRHWPVTGEITSSDTIWIDVDSSPVGAAQSGVVVYSSDGGANWHVTDLAHNGVVDDHDAWHANIGSFPGYTTIRYAVMLRDEHDAEYWDNNHSNDHLAEVNASATAITWHGNVRGGGALPTAVEMRTVSGNRAAFRADQFKEDTVFSLMRSHNLRDWLLERRFVSSLSAPEIEIDLPNGAGPYFYRLQVETVPSDDIIVDGEAVVIQIELTPPGASRGGNIAYSINGSEDWQVKPLRPQGVVDSRELWNAYLGQFPAGTTIRYAIELIDFFEVPIWNNNNSEDYLLVIE